MKELYADETGRFYERYRLQLVNGYGGRDRLQPTAAIPNHLDPVVLLRHETFDVQDKVPHVVLAAIAQWLCEYEEVCDAFTKHLAFSAKTVGGGLAPEYSFHNAVRSIDFFLATWEGCDDECNATTDYFSYLGDCDWDEQF